MAIHDTDKTQDNRAAPMPNMADTHTTRASDGTTAITNKIDDPAGPFVSTKDGAVKVNDGISNIGLFGPDSNGNTVIKIAAAGYDAATAADENLIFNSSQNVLKVVASGTLSIASQSVAATNEITRTSTVTHNLGFSPMVIAMAKINSTQFIPWSGSRLWSYGITAGGTITYGVEYFTMVISDTAVTFETQYLNGTAAPTTAGAMTIKYYLLQETAN